MTERVMQPVINAIVIATSSRQLITTVITYHGGMNQVDDECGINPQN